MNLIYSSEQFSETIQLKVRKVFRCTPCGYLLRREDVRKDKDGKYHCKFCDRLVDDITDTVTGNDFLEILAL